MNPLLAAGHVVYHKTIPEGKTNRSWPYFLVTGSDIMSLFTSKFNENTYMGTPFSKLHDFTYGAMKTLAIEEGMPNMAQCIDSIEMIHINR